MAARLRVVAVAAACLAVFGCGRTTPQPSRVTIMQFEAPVTMDPGDHTSSLTYDVLAPIYEALTKFGEGLAVEPSLATAWNVDATGTKWTFTLRRNVRFQDGSPFDAEAVAHSFARLVDPARGLAGGSRFRAILASVTAADTYTVVFTLRRPYAPFLRVTAVTPIVSEAADAKGILSSRAVGTGPYKFVEWRTGEHVLEERNNDYWGARPAAQQLLWTWTSEPVLMNMSVLTGEADIVNPLPPIFAEALQKSPRVQLIEGVGTSVFWVALNMQTKPLSDLRVRQALNYATDRDALVRTQLRGFGAPANSPLAPADFGYAAATRGYGYDPARAKRLLAEAGYGEGLTLKMAAQEEDGALAEALQGMWANVGVRLEIESMEHGVYSQTIFGSPRQKQAAGIDCVLAAWASDNADPDFQLSPLYATDAWSPASANLGFYSNPRLDALLANAAAELDPEKRKALYATAQQTIVDDAPHVLLYYPQAVAARHVGSATGAARLLPGGRIDFDGK